MQFKRQRSKILEECKEYLEKYEGTYWVKKTINKQHLKVSSDGTNVFDVIKDFTYYVIGMTADYHYLSIVMIMMNM